jgi:hypothetical protein
MISATPEEQARRQEVMKLVLESININRVIKLPDLDLALARPSDQFALVNIGAEPNQYSGQVGDFRYQFEGEEDLLHLMVTKSQGELISVQEGQSVAAFHLDGVPPALVWLKPGNLSQHFYVGHDDLVGNLILAE